MDGGRAALADVRAQHRGADHLSPFLRVPSTRRVDAAVAQADVDLLAGLHVAGAGDHVAVGARVRL